MWPSLKAEFSIFKAVYRWVQYCYQPQCHLATPTLFRAIPHISLHYIPLCSQFYKTVLRLQWENDGRMDILYPGYKNLPGHSVSIEENTVVWWQPCNIYTVCCHERGKHGFEKSLPILNFTDTSKLEFYSTSIHTEVHPNWLLWVSGYFICWSLHGKSDLTGWTWKNCTVKRERTETPRWSYHYVDTASSNNNNNGNFYSALPNNFFLQPKVHTKAIQTSIRSSHTHTHTTHTHTHRCTHTQITVLVLQICNSDRHWLWVVYHHPLVCRAIFKWYSPAPQRIFC